MTSLMDPSPVAETVVVARVPVVDRARTIVGFELVNRAPEDSTPQVDDREAVVTVSGLLGSVDVNLSAVVGEKLLFCSVDRAALVDAHALSLSPRRTVLEIPTHDVDEELLDAVRARKQDGFTIMVEHDERARQVGDLLALADLVKIDVRRGEPGAVIDLTHGYADHPVQLVAAGCDTAAEFNWAQAIGFELFIGRSVQVQESTSESFSAPLELSQIQLGVELLSEDLDLDRVEDILRGDPVLVAQLLNMASSGAGGGLRRQVRSLREALVVMGTVRLRQWAALVILGRHSQRETDALVTTLVRARMCELLARSRGIDGPFAFTAGLLSALDVLLGLPIKEVREQVTVGDDLTDAAFRRQGPVGDLITLVEGHERSLQTTGAGSDHAMTMIAAMAFSWATSYAQAMHAAESA